MVGPRADEVEGTTDDADAPWNADIERREAPVPAALHGQRLDKVVVTMAEEFSRNHLQSLIEAGHVRVDGVDSTTASRKVRAGQTIAVDLVPTAESQAFRPEALAIDTLFEDEHLMVVNKAAGLVVHPAAGNWSGTLLNGLLAHHRAAASLPRAGIVHRLDKDTSGVMVAAKTQLANAALTAAFAARDLDRAYLALAWGLPGPLAGEIEGAIGRDSRNRKRMAVVARGGKAALTHYRTLRAWATSVSLLECRLATGRTHQIRVHLAARGHPVVGDPVYLRRVPAAARSLPEPIRQILLDFPRQALHAARLGFAHPRTGKTLSFATDPPADMAALITALDRDLRPAQG
jgi:23S rRNA pseudouridine1911/1915/1917 synthase